MFFIQIFDISFLIFCVSMSLVCGILAQGYMQSVFFNRDNNINITNELGVNFNSLSLYVVLVHYLINMSSFQNKTGAGQFLMKTVKFLFLQIVRYTSYFLWLILGGLVLNILHFYLMDAFMFNLVLFELNYSSFMYYLSLYFFHDSITFLFSWILVFLVGTGLLYLYYIRLIFLQYVANYSFPFELPLLLVILLFLLRYLIVVSDLLLFLVLLETISLILVVLLSIQLTTRVHYWIISFLESGIKYFFISGLSTLFMALGLAVLWGIGGTTNLLILMDLFYFQPALQFYFHETLIFGSLMFWVGFFFKLGIVPFHNWLPDVYDGAELLIGICLMAIISPFFLLKFLLLAKNFLLLYSIKGAIFVNFFFFCAILSICVGTLGAFIQERTMRFFAYASLVHMGYILLLVSIGTLVSIFSAFLYLFFYYILIHFFFSLFLWIRYVSIPFSNFSGIYLKEWSIVHNISFWIFVIYCVLFFSFAGVPPFGGFLPKLIIVIQLLIEQWYITLSIVIISFLINAYLYFQFITRNFVSKQDFFFNVQYGRTLIATNLRQFDITGKVFESNSNSSRNKFSVFTFFNNSSFDLEILLNNGQIKLKLFEFLMFLVFCGFFFLFFFFFFIFLDYMWFFFIALWFWF